MVTTLDTDMLNCDVMITKRYLRMALSVIFLAICFQNIW